MRNHNDRIRSLLAPSVFSGTVTLVLSAIVLGRAAWEYISNGQLFYNYLFGAYGIHTYFWENAPRLSGSSRVLLDKSVVYYVSIAGVAVVAGLVVYALLQGLSVLFRDGRELLHEVEYVEQSKRSGLLRELLTRLLLRIVVLGGWAVYMTYFLATLLPFAIALTEQGVYDIQATRPLGWLLCLAAALFLSLAIHLHAVFLRLCFLRTRIF